MISQCSLFLRLHVHQEPLLPARLAHAPGRSSCASSLVLRLRLYFPPLHSYLIMCDLKKASVWIWGTSSIYLTSLEWECANVWRVRERQRRQRQQNCRTLCRWHAILPKSICTLEVLNRNQVDTRPFDVSRVPVPNHPHTHTHTPTFFLYPHSRATHGAFLTFRSPSSLWQISIKQSASFYH